MTTFTDQEQSIEDQAAFWLVRLDALDCTPEDRFAFEVWKQQDPAHERMLLRLQKGNALVDRHMTDSRIVAMLEEARAERHAGERSLAATLRTAGGLAALAALLGALALEALVLLALVFGAVSAAHTPLRLALLPRLVERAALPSAIGLSAIAFNSSRIIAPAIGAGLLAMASPPLAFAAASAACAGATGLLWRVTGTARQPGAATAGSFAEQLAAGFRYVLRSPGLRLVFLLTLTNGLLGRTALELLPAVSGQLLGGGSTSLATLSAAAGLGSIVGGLIVSRQSGRLRRLFQLALFGLAMAALILLSAGLWRSVVAVALAISLVSLCTTMIGTGCQALTQLSVDEAHCGRVMSLWSVLSMGAPALGAVALGSVADGLGFPAAFAASALCALLVAALARPGGRRFQH